ncbi:hypothetical protein AGIG_G5373 [Arapaima gigas]
MVIQTKQAGGCKQTWAAGRAFLSPAFRLAIGLQEDKWPRRLAKLRTDGPTEWPTSGWIVLLTTAGPQEGGNHGETVAFQSRWPSDGIRAAKGKLGRSVVSLTLLLAASLFFAVFLLLPFQRGKRASIRELGKVSSSSASWDIPLDPVNGSSWPCEEMTFDPQ